MHEKTSESPESTRRSLADGLMLVKQTLFESLAGAKCRGDTAGIAALSRELRSTTDQLAKLDGLHAPQRTEVTVSVSHDMKAVIGEAERQLLAIAAARHERQQLPVIEGEVIP
ncbi:hypothetical protein [Mycobacterium sp. SM3041]|uniref:hypothetical protein n=1 Tax=Mycobacterium sp. SM3041 TaxID=3114291 RepID=UPI0032047B89